MLKDFLWVINKRWGWASEEHLSLSVHLSLSLIFSQLPLGQTTLVLHAAEAVMTHECFTGRRSVGCKFTAYSWFKCINIRGVILCLHTNTYTVGAFHSQMLMILTNSINIPTFVMLISNFCLRRGFQANNLDYCASNVGYNSAAVGLCKKTAFSKSDVEPTVLNLYFSQWLSQINQITSCTHPLLSVCGLLPWWPV